MSSLLTRHNSTSWFASNSALFYFRSFGPIQKSLGLSGVPMIPYDRVKRSTPSVYSFFVNFYRMDFEGADIEVQILLGCLKQH